jgi:hypothetical protein
LPESEKGQGSNDGGMREFELKCDDAGNQLINLHAEEEDQDAFPILSL